MSRCDECGAETFSRFAGLPKPNAFAGRARWLCDECKDAELGATRYVLRVCDAHCAGILVRDDSVKACPTCGGPLVQAD